jgi:hypothetical protein
MRPDRPCFTRTLITAGITAALGFTILPASAAPEHGHDHPPAAISAAPPQCGSSSPEGIRSHPKPGGSAEAVGQGQGRG